MTAPVVSTKRGLAVEADAHADFVARVYMIDGPPDSDGDVILATVPDGTPVAVSLEQHDVIVGGAEPAASGKLYTHEGAVYVHGTYAATARGRALQERLRTADGRDQWSIGWRTASAKTRPPTAAEMARKGPDTKRFILDWRPIEASPVRRGSCGAMCRTVSAKCAGNACACSQREEADAATRRLVAELGDVFREAEAAAEAFKAGRPLGITEVKWMYVADDDWLSRAAEAVCTDLKMAPVRIRYHVGDRRSGGLYSPAIDPDVVWVAVEDGRNSFDRLRSLGHELRHVWQERGLAPAWVTSRRARERDAKEYGEKLRHSDPSRWDNGVVEVPWYNPDGSRLW